jgi:hypothetical protein
MKINRCVRRCEEEKQKNKEKRIEDVETIAITEVVIELFFTKLFAIVNENKYNSSITLLRCTSINKHLLCKCMRLSEVKHHV